jgi:hypothetical protein
MIQSLIGQVRTRFNLLPGASRGWRPNKFTSVGRAIEFAMVSKRMKFSWLAQATRVPIEKLKQVVREGENRVLSHSEIEKVEMYLGVPVMERKIKRVEYCKN